ncbi:MAG: enoyl-CoA hydratase/isomerase family protein, partial [Deltaproteobacteria bacterium]|nr:enoyl-CoA hydratase/isomerase family protein [Deltaproteobacteria bacterium]
MDYSTIKITKDDGYVIVTLNRPNEMNALSKDMRLELENCFYQLEKDDSVKAVILTGGDYVFSAGMDIKEMSALPDGEIDDYFSSMIKYLQRIYSFKKPVIAAVGG